MSSNQKKIAALELNGLTRVFSGQHQVGPITLVIPHGEFLTLLGPSGCGKTTILRMIAGLEQVDAGSITLFGQDITSLAAEKRPIHTIFQRYGLFPHMNVWENVAFGLRMQRQAPSEISPRVEEALRWVQLEGFAKRAPSSLSGGQQQRVAIARAVVNRPQVLLLDESLSALDYTLRRRMQNELKALQRQLGITFIFVTHDQEEALSMADRIIVMREGVIEQDGIPREIYEKPRNLFVANFIGESNILDAQVLSVSSAQSVWALIEGKSFEINVSAYLKRDALLRIEGVVGSTLKILLRPEDLRITEVNDHLPPEGIVGYVRERNYRGMTLDSLIELESGKILISSEFFNEDDPDVDHSLHQKVSVTWVPTWEVVLADEA